MRVTNLKYRTNEVSGAALAASRQVWLAGLGAAVISRDWIQTEAGNTFKALVKEGTVVESKAIRYLGDRLETSMARANQVWRRTRSTVEHTVRQAADSAVLMVRDTLPRSLPKIELATPAAPAKRTAAKRRTRAAQAAKAAVRKTKSAKRVTAKRATGRKSA